MYIFPSAREGLLPMKQLFIQGEELHPLSPEYFSFKH